MPIMPDVAVSAKLAVKPVIELVVAVVITELVEVKELVVDVLELWELAVDVVCITFDPPIVTWCTLCEYVTWMYQKYASWVTDAGVCIPSTSTIGCSERRLFAIVTSKKPRLPDGPETVKLRILLVESKVRLVTVELLTTCIWSPRVLPLVTSVEAVVEVTVLVSMTVVRPVIVLWVCVVVVEHVAHASTKSTRRMRPGETVTTSLCGRKAGPDSALTVYVPGTTNST